MTTLLYAGRIGDDLERIRLHLSGHGVNDVDARIDEIFDAMQLLTLHPLIGRSAAQDRRELVIGQGSRGYVALYAYDPIDDVAAVLALRAQREAGFAD